MGRYGEAANLTADQNTIVRNNLQESATMFAKDCYEDNEEFFKNMTGNNLDEFIGTDGEMRDDMMHKLVPEWNSSWQQMTDKVKENGGFEDTYKGVFKDLDKASNKYSNSVQKSAKKAGKDVGDLVKKYDENGEALDKNSDATDKNTKKTKKLNKATKKAEKNIKALTKGYNKNRDAIKNLLSKNGDLIKKYGDEVDSIKKVKTALDELIQKYQDAQKAAMDMIDASIKAREEEAKKVASEKQNVPTSTPKATTSSTPKTPTSSSSKTTTSSSKTKTTTTTKKRSDKDYYGVALSIWNGGGGWGIDPQRSQKLKEKGFDPERIRRLVSYTLSESAKSGSWYGQFEGIKDLSPYAYNKFKTGGYTGEWGDEGKLAVLHEKELVLNKDDTKNILNAVNIVRDAGGILKSLSQSMNNRIAGFFDNMQKGYIPSDKNDTVEQNVHITAEFPGVRDSREIENALNNLINSASQYAFRRKP